MSMSVFDDFRFSYERIFRRYERIFRRYERIFRRYERIFRRYERINIVNQKTEVLEECQEKS